MTTVPRPRSFSAGTNPHRVLKQTASDPMSAAALLKSKKKDLNEKRSTIVNSNRYKTELCRAYQENGSCKYGDKCQFAHGTHELRTLPRHPKYKTELCRTFYTQGYCPYGPRCHFVHKPEERRTVESNQMLNDTQIRDRPSKDLAWNGENSPPQSPMSDVMPSPSHTTSAADRASLTEEDDGVFVFPFNDRANSGSLSDLSVSSGSGQEDNGAEVTRVAFSPNSEGYGSAWSLGSANSPSLDDAITSRVMTYYHAFSNMVNH